MYLSVTDETKMLLWFIYRYSSAYFFCVTFSFPSVPRCMPQKCQLLWQQGSHPHDAVPLPRGPRGLPAGCAAG